MAGSGVAASVTKVVQREHARLGMLAARRPWTVIGLCLVGSAALIAGNAFMTVETSFDKLYMPRDSTTMAIKRFAINAFGPMPRPNGLLLRAARATPGGQKVPGMLDKRLLGLAMQLHLEVLGLNASGVAFDAVCIKLPSGKCITNNVFGYWKGKPDRLMADADPLATVADDGAKDENYLPIIRDQVMIPVKDKESGAVVGASAILLIYPTSAGDDPLASMDFAPESVLRWERDFSSWAVQARPRAAAVGIELMHAAYIDGADSIKTEMGANVVLIPLAIVAMIAYLLSQLGSCDAVGGRKGLALVAVASVLLAYGAALGFTGYLGWAFNQLTQVGIFVLLGIGIDDTFIIVDALEAATRGGEMITDDGAATASSKAPRRKKQSDEEVFVAKVGEAMAEAGSSILLTTVTAITSFLISATIDMEGVRTFCGVSALALALIYTLQCTLVVATYVLDCRRMMARRLDLCCCVARPVGKGRAALGQTLVTAPEEKLFARFLAGPYASFLSAPGMPRLAAMLMALLIGSGAMASQLLERGQSASDVLPSNSYVFEYYAMLDALSGPDSEYTATLDLSLLVSGMPFDESSLQMLHDLTTELKADDAVHSQAVSWLEVFETWRSVRHGVSSVVGGGGRGDSLPEQLSKFLDDPQFGAPFKRDMVCDGGAKSKQRCAVLRATRLHLMTDLATGQNIARYVPGMLRIKAICEKWRAKGLRVHAFSEGFLYMERLQLIDRTWLPNIAMAFVAVLLAMLCFQPPPVAVVAAGCIGSTIMCMLSVMLLWGVKVNMISNMLLILSIGYSVDFTAHIAQAFYARSQHAEGQTPHDLIAFALGSVGASVLNGGLSTLAATVVLAASNVLVMQTMFKLFFATVTLGLLHGFFFLPALLQLAR